MSDKRLNLKGRDPCRAKRRYASAGAARHAMRQRGHHRQGCRVYPCRRCDGWHYGHADQAMGRAARVRRAVAAIDRAVKRSKNH